MLQKAEKGDGSAIAPFLRQCDIDELTATRGHGVNLAEVLEQAISLSQGDSWVCMDHGEVVALGGVRPSPDIGLAGIAWMVAAYGCPPKVFLKDIMPAVEEMKKKYEVICNVVDARNSKSIQWLSHLGFRFGDVLPYYGELRIPFIQFYMVKLKNV